MRVMTTTADASPVFSKLSLSLACSAKEVREVQRLRYKVLSAAMGMSALSNPDGLDIDEFDQHCSHLIVRDSKSLKVVGTCRILGPNAARHIGRYACEAGFDLVRLQHIRGRLAEMGRVCIHPDYRGAAVMKLLWAGLAAYMQRERYAYLIGCASISLADGGQNVAAVYRHLNETQFSPLEYRVQPQLAFALEGMDERRDACLPPLLNAYLRAGAWVCGEPAWNHDLHCADLFVMLPLANLEQRTYE